MQIKSKNIRASYLLMSISFLWAITLCPPIFANSEENILNVLFTRQSEKPLSFSIIDVNRNDINEVVISDNGFLRAYEWSVAKFVEKWKSTQYSYVLPGSADDRAKSMTVNAVSTVFPVQYKSGDSMKRTLLFYAQPVPKKSDMFELYYHNGNYSVQKRLDMLPSTRSPYQICDDQTTTLLGKKSEKGKDQIAAYAWNGNEIIEKWPGISGYKGALPGQLYITPTTKKNIVLLLGSENSILYCDKSQYHTKAIGKIASPFPGYNDGRSVVGITKKESLGELWTIEIPIIESAFFYKLYMAQFSGTEFSPFKKINIRGINTDRVSTIIIVDLDNDGVGEIIGSEVAGTLISPKEGEGPELKNERSYIFVAKWDGTEYVLKWRHLAADSVLQKISVDDVTGDGKKEIIAVGSSLANSNYYLYVFSMPVIEK